MELTSDLIYGFAGALLSQRYDNPLPTPQFHRQIWEYCCSPSPRVAIAAPRGHAKSTAITHAYVLASVLFRKHDFVVIISDTEQQAIQFLGDIKIELSENEDLKRLFDIKLFLKDSEKEIQVQMGQDKKIFRILVRGASGGSGSVRGFKWRGKRPNLIVCDDIENDEAVMNEDRRAKFREWFYGALLPSLSDDGKIRFVGTVLHFDSLLERLMPPTSGDRAKFTKTLGLVQWSEDPLAAWKSIKYRAHTDFDDFTQILWPEKFNEIRLRAYRDDYILQGYPEGYAQEYLNYPIVEIASFFKKKDFIPMTEDDHNRIKRFYAAADLALSRKEKRSYTAIVVGGVDELGVLHIVHVFRARIDSKELVDKLLEIQIEYKPELFVLEKGQISLSIGPFLQDEQFKRGVFLNKIEKPPMNDKKARARAIQGRMRQGGVHFDTEAPWWPSFHEELLRFDRGEYDDQVDAIAWLGQILNELIEAPTIKEMQDMDDEEEIYRTGYGSSFAAGGRSQVTGY